MASTSPYSIVMLGTSSPEAAEAEDASLAEEASLADDASLAEEASLADDAEEALLVDEASVEDSLSDVADASPADAADDAAAAEVAELSFDVDAGFELPHPATAAAIKATAMIIETILSFFILTSLLIQKSIVAV